MLRPLILGTILAMASQIPAATTVPVYFGTYTGGESKGIYLAEFNMKTGEVSVPKAVGEAENPSFLAKHPTLPIIYSVSETRAGGERKGAAIIAWKIESGKLSEIGRASSGSDGPCHVSVSPDGKLAAIANYSGGSVTLVTLDDAGRPTTTDNVQHKGGSHVNEKRQEAAHAHCVRFSPDGSLLMVSDLGQDRILAYQVEGGKLTAKPSSGVDTAPGAGPRHIRFTPNGKFLVVINELNNTVASFHYDAAKKTLSVADTAETLPDGYTENNSTAEVVIHPSGKFIYGSNRGHDSIAVFALDDTSGELKRIEITDAAVKTPRNFNLVGDSWLIAVGQDSSTGSVFKIDPATGKLTKTDNEFKIPKSVCVLPLDE